MTFETTVSGVSALVAVVSAFIAGFALWESRRQWTQESRREELRKNDILAWSNEVISALESLSIICIHHRTSIDEVIISDLRSIKFRTAILVEQGRLFFKNVITDSHGAEKQPAYRGYRPEILDRIVVAHQIACKWHKADEDCRLRMGLVAEDCLKEFVSLAQQEIGRSRNSAQEPGEAGMGMHLEGRIARLEPTRLNAALRRQH